MNQTNTSWSFEESPLGRSFLWGLAIVALPVASGFVVSWVIARWAGSSTLGTVSWVMSYATAVLIVGKFGLDLAASRLASEYGIKFPGTLRKLFHTAFGLRLVFTFLVALLSFLFAGPIATFFKDPTLVVPVRVGALVVVCASVYEFNENFLIGLNRLPTVYRIRSVHVGSRVVATCVLVFLGAGAAPILGGYCAAWLLAIGLYAWLLNSYLPQSEPSREPPAILRRLVALSATLALSGASVTIYSHTDRLMLGYFVGVDEVGQFAVAKNTAEVSIFPVYAMVMMLRPALASRFSTDRIAESAVIIRNSLRYSFVSGVLFASILATLGVPLVRFVFSDEFTYAGGLMVFFVGVLLLRSVGAIILPALVAAERTRFYAYLTAATAVLNIVLNLVLIPAHQSRGAVVATILSYGLLMVLGLREVFARFRLSMSLRAFSLAVRTILAGATASGALWWKTHQMTPGWNTLVWASLVAALYFVLIFAFRVGGLDDVRGLLSNLRKQKS